MRLVLLLAPLLVVACGSDGTVESAAEAQPSLTIESCGRSIPIDDQPKRAVGLEQAATEVLLSLGLADRMVGTSYLTDPILPELADDYERVPVLAEQYPSPEVLRAAEPDFLYSMLPSAFAKEVAGTREELADLGIRAYLPPTGCEEPASSEPFSFDGLFQQYEDIAAIFGVDERGKKLVDEQRLVLERAEAARRTGVEPSILWFYSSYDGAPYVGGTGGVPDAVSRLVGGRSAFDDATTTWPEVSWEAITERDPDVIVVADLDRGRPGDSAEDKIEFLRTDPVASKLTAVQEDRIVIVPGSQMDPSVRSVQAVQLLADALAAMELQS